MTTDQRQIRRDRIERIREARDAAPAESAFLADMIGSFVESGRDAWIHRDGILLGHASCADMDVIDGVARIGNLSVDLGSAIEELGDTSFRHEGSTFHVNAPDHEGNGEWGLARLAVLRDQWIAEDRTIVATVAGRSPIRIDASAIVLGPVPCGDLEVHGLVVPALECSIPFCDFGTVGLVEHDGIVAAHPSNGPAIMLSPNRD